MLISKHLLYATFGYLIIGPSNTQAKEYLSGHGGPIGQALVFFGNDAFSYLVRLQELSATHCKSLARLKKVERRVEKVSSYSLSTSSLTGKVIALTQSIGALIVYTDLFFASTLRSINALNSALLLAMDSNGYEHDLQGLRLLRWQLEASSQNHRSAYHIASAGGAASDVEDRARSVARELYQALRAVDSRFGWLERIPLHLLQSAVSPESVKDRLLELEAAVDATLGLTVTTMLILSEGNYAPQSFTNSLNNTLTRMLDGQPSIMVTEELKVLVKDVEREVLELRDSAKLC